MDTVRDCELSLRLVEILPFPNRRFKRKALACVPSAQERESGAFRIPPEGLGGIGITPDRFDRKVK